MSPTQETKFRLIQSAYHRGGILREHKTNRAVQIRTGTLIQFISEPKLMDLYEVELPEVIKTHEAVPFKWYDHLGKYLTVSGMELTAEIMKNNQHEISRDNEYGVIMLRIGQNTVVTAH